MDINADINVLREMVRIAENRRSEELEGIEKMNRYNLALIAFSGSFLSLIITIHMPTQALILSGLLLSISIICSLTAIFPRRLVGGVLAIDQDVTALEGGQSLHIKEYMLVTAKLTDTAAQKAGELVGLKKKWTIISALILAFSIFITYIVTVCHALRIL